MLERIRPRLNHATVVAYLAKDLQGFLLDKDEVNLDVLAREPPANRYSHFQVVGVRKAGGCQFSGVITPST